MEPCEESSLSFQRISPSANDKSAGAPAFAKAAARRRRAPKRSGEARHLFKRRQLDKSREALSREDMDVGVLPDP